MTIMRGKSAVVAGSGYAPGSTVEIWLGSPSMLLGTVTVGPDGSYSTTVTIPADIAAGAYVVQSEGWAANGVNRRTVGTGITISAQGLPTTGRGDLALVLALFALVMGIILRRSRAQFTP